MAGRNLGRQFAAITTERGFSEPLIDERGMVDRYRGGGALWSHEGLPPAKKHQHEFERGGSAASPRVPTGVLIVAFADRIALYRPVRRMSENPCRQPSRSENAETPPQRRARTDRSRIAFVVGGMNEVWGRADSPVVGRFDTDLFRLRETVRWGLVREFDLFSRDPGRRFVLRRHTRPAGNRSPYDNGHRNRLRCRTGRPYGFPFALARPGLPPVWLLRGCRGRGLECRMAGAAAWCASHRTVRSTASFRRAGSWKPTCWPSAALDLRHALHHDVAAYERRRTVLETRTGIRADYFAVKPGILGVPDTPFNVMTEQIREEKKKNC